MAQSLIIDRERAALLVMDYQTAIVGMVKDPEPLLRRAQRAIAAARAAAIPIIYVVIGFRPEYPEVSPRNQGFSAIKETGRFLLGDEASRVHPAVEPQPGDLTVVKHRVSAFAGSDLEMILRSRGIETLVLLGIATSGVVLSTVRLAADLDFRLLVLEDCCADPDEEVHRVLLGKVFQRQAKMVTAADFGKALAAAT